MLHILARARVAHILRLLVAAAAIATLAGPLSAFAATSGPTMVVTLKAFPGGTQIPNQIAGTFQVTSGGPVSLVAPQIAYGPNGQSYGFVFWNTTNDVRTTPAVSFTAPTDTSTFHVTAWYLPLGGDSCPGCPPPTGVTTYAFSLNNDAIIADTPIASVTPASAWSGAPSTTVSTTSSSGPVAITARQLISTYGKFHNWLPIAGNGTASNDVLNVPNKGASVAIAFFGIPVPDPCEGDRNALESLSPSDFPSFAAYQRAKAVLTKQLLDCEHQNGEL